MMPLYEYHPVGVSHAMRLWITFLFKQEPLIQRIGYTTWSGNHRMMKVGEKLGHDERSTNP